MSGLAEFDFAGVQAKKHLFPSDMDAYQQFIYYNIGTSPGAFGTVTSATANPAFVLDNIRADYPRNVLFTLGGVAGGMGGTAVVNGVDRWGNSIQETLGFGSAAGGGSVSGTRIFSRVTSATLTSIDGLGGTANGTASLGYAMGTGAAVKMWLGLPTRIGGTSDVKSITYIKNFVSTALGGGTITSAMVDATYHAISGTEIAGSAHTYVVTFRSTYDNLGKGDLANL